MCRGVPMHIASDLWEVARRSRDGWVQIGGMRSCRPTPRIETPRRAVCPHTAAGNIKP